MSIARRTIRFALTLGVLGATLFPTIASAQVRTFDLAGVVRDEQGGVLAGVALTIRNEATGLTRTMVTDANGFYYFANLPPQGTWELVAELSGFATANQTRLEFYANTKPVLNVTMKVGQMHETVSVASEAPLIDTGHATLGLSIAKQQIQELPLNGRDYLDLVVLGSGVSDVTGPGSTVLGSRSQSISGAYARYTSYQLDGFNNTRDQHGVQRLDLSLDAISEFRVLTNQFSAEYGETIGGIVSAITKSGTNALRGSAFLFARPGKWDAKDPLTGIRASFDRQDVGFTLGGPIVKDVAHYFASLEYRNEDQEAIVTAPIANGRFRGTFPVGTNRTRFMVKGNHRFNGNNLLEGKFVVGDETIFDGVGGLNIAENLRTNVNDDKAAQITYTRLFGNQVINELRVSRAEEDYSSSAQPPTFTPTGVALSYPTQGNLGATNLRQTAPDSTFQLGDTLTLHRGSHTFKFGGDAYRTTPGGVLLTNLNGSYLFSPTAPFPFDPNNPASFPISYSQGFFGTGDPEVVVIKWRFGAFVQDDWKINRRLTLNLGARYHRETTVPDKNNFTPRFGLTWDVTGDGKTILRGGAGIFHSSVFSTIDAFEGFNNPNGFRNVTFAPGDPNFPQFPNTLPGPNFPPGVIPPPGDFYLQARDFAPDKRKNPESRNVTIGIERQFGADYAMTFDVSHNRGTNLLVPTDVNVPAPFDYSRGGRRTPQAADATRPFGVPGRPIPTGVVSYLPNGYPFSNYRDLYLLGSDGRSTYTAISITATRRYRNNFSLQGNYTWSRSRNNGDDFRPGNSMPLNPTDRNAEWGRSFTDIPHSFSVNGLYGLPLGFQISGIARARSGSPIDPRVGQDLNGDRNTRERPFADGRILQRNSFRARSFASLDLGMAKNLRIGRTTLQGRLEIFNVANRLNPMNVSNTYGPDANNPLPAFLRINSALAPRQYQLAARLTF